MGAEGKGEQGRREKKTEKRWRTKVKVRKEENGARPGQQRERKTER